MVVESKPDSGAKTAHLAPSAPNASRVRASVSGPDPGACGDFHIGHGGFCDDLHDGSSGPTGYWCSQSPPRGPSFAYSLLCTRFTRAGIEWRR